MRRRDLIAMLGGAGAAWPLLARAQQTAPKRRVGVLMSPKEGDPEGEARMAAFRQGLEELGWVEGRNLEILTRWAGGDPDTTVSLSPHHGLRGGQCIEYCFLRPFRGSLEQPVSDRRRLIGAYEHFDRGPFGIDLEWDPLHARRAPDLDRHRDWH